MSRLDQDAFTSGLTNNGMAPGYGGHSAAPSRAAEMALEPELEGSSYQTAPITSLALARWAWAVAGLLIGALGGFLAAMGGGYQATSTLQIAASSGSSDATGQKSIGQSLQALATSDGVLQEAVATLRANPKFLDAADKTFPSGATETDAAKGRVAGSITVAYVDTTSIVTITASDPNPLVAIYESQAVATAVKKKQQDAADDAIAALKAEASNLMSVQTVGPNSNPVESARQQAIGQELGTKMASAGFTQKQSVSVIKAIKAEPTGNNQSVSALLGGAGGAFLGALAAVAAGAGRRRPHSPRELMSLAPDLVVRTTVQAGELAGRILETGHRAVVVLAMPDTRFASTQLSMAIAHHLRTHGATVAVVDRVTDSSPGSASEDRLWALRRDVRRNIPVNFSADMLVVVCGADEEALSLIAGQSDLLVAVVAKQRKTVLADIRRTIDAVRISEPVVVLSR